MANYVMTFRGRPGRTLTAEEEARWPAWFGQISASVADRGNRVGQARSVGYHGQQGVAGIAVAHPVLVGTALPDAAFLIDGEFHVRPMKDLRRLPRSANQGAGMGSSAPRRVRAFCSA